jgi:CheY-like chemotaxis protein
LLGLSSKLGVCSEFWFALDLDEATTHESNKLQSSHAIATVSGLKDIRILVVDDNAINLEVAKRILQLQGATVSLASDGQKAVDMLTAQPQAYDAVLMDIQMPEMDGLAATRFIREKLGLTRLPIIALSAGAMLEEQQEAAAAGMNDFVSKPFEVKRLVTSIRALIAATPVPAGKSTAAVMTEAHWPDIEGVNVQEAFQHMAGDWNMYIGMLKLLFREHLNETNADHFVESGDSLVILGRRMHKLKGAAGTLGLNDVYRLSSAAEAACVAGDNAAALEATDQVDDALRRVQVSAAPHLTVQAQALETALDVPSTPLTLQDLDDLRSLLHRQSLDALGRFETLRGQIRPLLKAAEFDALENCMQELQFAKAADLLAPLFV